MKTIARSLLVALVLALALPSQAATYTSTLTPVGVNTVVTWGVLQNLTGTAPSAGTEGVALNTFGANNRRGCSVTIYAQAAATLTNLVTKGYVWIPGVGAWTRYTALDFNVTAVSDRFYTAPFIDMSHFPPGSRVEIVPNGTTVSAGTQVTTVFSCP